MCGGTALNASSLCHDLGLSPRVRGNLLATSGGQVVNRSIPACAGEPYRPCTCVAPVGVYPRVYGGTTGGVSDGTTLWGLSPRVRGNHHDGSVGSLETRSIPACTGNPYYRCPSWTNRRSIPASAGEPRPAEHPPLPSAVYPRVCGGTVLLLILAEIQQGLSPRVRGNQ